MIIFKKARAKNFLSVGNSFFEYDLNQDPLTLIKGKNSEGKSTLIDLLTFGLYKKAYRNINLPQLVNNINKKDCLVEIEFSINKTNWKVVRGLSPNVFEIYKDGSPLDQHSSIIEQQKWLEQNVLRMTYKTFVQIVILGSGGYVPFMQLTAADRRDVIEDLLDIKMFSLMNGIVKDKIKFIKEELKILKIKKESSSDKIKMQEDFIQELERIGQQNINEKSDQIQTLFKRIEEIKETIKTLELKRKELEDNQDSYSSSLDLLKELNTSKLKISHQVSSITERFKFFKQNDTCPTCSQGIDESIKKEKLKQAQKEIKILKDDNDKLKLLIEKEEERENTYQQIKNQIREVQEQLNFYHKEVNSLTLQIQSLHQEIKNHNNQCNNTTQENEKLEEYKEAYQECNKEYIQYLEDIQYFTYVANLLKDSGVKASIVKKYLKIMNQQINKYLALLDMNMNFTLDDEFNEEITTPTFERFSYGNFSEGQKRRVDLALLFTWRYISALKNSASTNLLICDEILDGSMDEMGHSSFLRIVKQELKNTNVFVISHREGIESKFDRVITVEKRGHFSFKDG